MNLFISSFKMKKFIKRGIVFLLLTLIVLLSLGISSVLITQQTFNYSICEDKNILIVGNSHTECGINDKVLKRSTNLSKSASSFFYHYIKLKSFSSKNSHIDTIIVSLNYDDLWEIREDRFLGDERIEQKMNQNIFMFAIEDYFDLLKANPVSVILQSLVMYSEFYNLQIEGRSLIGGYKILERYKLEQAKEIFWEGKEEDGSGVISQSELKYLIRVYKYCESHHLKLILINTPLHPLLEKELNKHEKDHIDLINKNMPNASYLNHANFVLPDSAFSDLSHLNYKGATIYSQYLQEQFDK
jgi:hypothetical protein